MDEDTDALVPLESRAAAEIKEPKALALRPPEELAGEIGKALDVIARRLDLATPHPATARRVRGARTVPRDFVLSLMAAVEGRPDLPYLGKFDSARARAVLESSEANRLIAERVALFLARLNYTIEARWAEVVAEAMHLFSLASIVASRDNPELAAEVENLRRQLGRKGQGKKKRKKPATDEKPPE